MCSCGDPESHVIARRRTAQGTAVWLFDDGALASWADALPGVPVARPRTPEGRRLTLDAGWLFVGEVEVYDDHELAALYVAAKRIAKRGGTPGDLRAETARELEPKITFHWNDEGDYRTCVLPRIEWPGMAVRHERGVYEVMHWRHTGAAVACPGMAWMPSGFRFRTIEELTKFLNTQRARVRRRAA